MSYSKLYFGKELTELTYDDIEKFFIEEKEESNKIEFKSYHNPDEKNHTEKENAVIKTICGLLNSEGGIVIWGAPVGQSVEGKKEKIFKGELSPSDKLIEKDTFISRVTDTITPSPNGISFQSLEKSGKYIYVIEAKQSFYSPHQFRNIYHMRIDGQTKPAPHHYIEALFRKVTFPKLEGYIKIEDSGKNGSQLYLTITSIIFNKSKLQNEDDIYYRLCVFPGTFQYHAKDYRTDRYYNFPGDMIVNNAVKTLYYNQPLSNTETIFIDTAVINKHNEVRIFLYFGGKKSPLMVSEYSISNREILSRSKQIVIIEENSYMYERSDKLEKSEEERMKILIGR
jgi:hypothetical protein